MSSRGLQAWVVRTPNGAINTADATESELAYVCTVHGLAWSPCDDADAMRATIHRWADEIRERIEAERRHCEAFLAEIQRESARYRKTLRGDGDSVRGAAP